MPFLLIHCYLRSYFVVTESRRFNDARDGARQPRSSSCRHKPREAYEQRFIWQRDFKDATDRGMDHCLTGSYLFGLRMAVLGLLLVASCNREQICFEFWSRSCNDDGLPLLTTTTYYPSRLSLSLSRSEDAGPRILIL